MVISLGSSVQLTDNTEAEGRRSGLVAPAALSTAHHKRAAERQHRDNEPCVYVKNVQNNVPTEKDMRSHDYVSTLVPVRQRHSSR